MVTFMTSDTLSKLYITKDTYFLNLSSFKMGFQRVNLAPPYECTSLEPKLFDMMYAKFILENNIVFMELMNIIVPVFEGKSIVILITMGDGWDVITESLQKFLQQRYNIISTICYNPEDYEYGQEVIMNKSSLYNFEQDRKRFLNLFVMENGEDIVKKSIITNDNISKYF